MNQKELNEIRRRWKLDKNAVSNIYGCYVNSAREIISQFDTSFGLLTHDEAEMYLNILKKTLSGTLGKNLIDIEFATAQVADSDEHRLLMTLKKDMLRNDEARGELCKRIIEALSLEDESGYLILLAADAYDVPHHGRGGAELEDGGEVFKYFLCCICPVKSASAVLGYKADSGEFHSSSAGQTLAAPTLGFMFPCFDGRATNIYNALYYTHKPAELHQELIDAVFRTPALMSAPAQKDAFGAAMADSLDKDCSFDVVQSVHEHIRARIAEHKEAKDPDKLELTIKEVGAMLKDSGLDDEKVESFQEKCEKEFGDNAALDPNNIIDAKKFKIETPDIKISVSPENSYLIETRVISGRKYLLIPADTGVEVNGINVSITD